MSWWEWVLLSLGADAVGTVPAYAFASMKMGSVPKTQIHADYEGWQYSNEERALYDFWAGSRALAPVWPIQLIAALCYGIFYIGLFKGIESLGKNMEQQSIKNADRKLLPERQERYDKLWEKRNALPFGKSLPERQEREMKLLAEKVMVRGDERLAPDYQHYMYHDEEMIKCSCDQFKTRYFTDRWHLVQQHYQNNDQDTWAVDKDMYKYFANHTNVTLPKEMIHKT